MNKILNGKSIFKENIHNQEFNNKGFFTIPLLDLEECFKLIEILPEIGYIYDSKITFKLSIRSQNVEYKKHVNNVITEYVDGKIKNLCNNYKIVRGVFVEKMPGENNFVELHADDCSCDEDNYIPFHIWIPLVDTSVHNGCIAVVRSSHMFTSNIRGINISNNYIKHSNIIMNEYAESIELMAGEALIYHPALLHFSYVNKSNKTRPAISSVCIPESATPLVYYKNKDFCLFKRQIYSYDMSYDDYLFWNEKNEPNTKKHAITKQINDFNWIEFKNWTLRNFSN